MLQRRLMLACALALVSIEGCEAPARTQASVAGESSERHGIHWESWSNDVFERAQREHKLVLLDLEAVWCHWCHVMEETTYADPAVAALIREHFIAVKVDQDARPDLSNRYEDYGWPATILFDARGLELVKRAGYIPPPAMASLLRAVIADPTPGPSVVPADKLEYARAGALDAELRVRMEATHVAAFDEAQAGFGRGHKYLDLPSVEYSIARALDGDAQARTMARRTLDAARALIDPAWGGVYQYSTDGVWTEPHFEKIMSYQADDLRAYALGYAAWKDPAYLQAARDIERFLRERLTHPEGGFYTSQDADLVQGEHAGEYFALDDAQRRALGTPRIDTHIYARENGWAIRALTSLYAVTGDESVLARARRAAEWILVHRTFDDGGFRHDFVDVAGPYLGDTLAMGQAFLSLYAVTAERAWLLRAQQAAKYIAQHFVRADMPAGVETIANDSEATGPLAASTPQRDENVQVARFANLLFHLTGDASDRALAERAMRYLATPQIAERGFPGGILLADRELAGDPVHVTVVGSKRDAAARALFDAARAYPATYLRCEWWDAREGPLPHADVELPELERAAAFGCAGGRCGSPAFEPSDVARRLDTLLGRNPP